LKKPLNAYNKFALDLYKKNNEILIIIVNKIQELQAKEEQKENKEGEKPEEILKFIGWLIFNEIESVMSLYFAMKVNKQRL